LHEDFAFSCHGVNFAKLHSTEELLMEANPRGSASRKGIVVRFGIYLLIRVQGRHASTFGTLGRIR